MEVGQRCAMVSGAKRRRETDVYRREKWSCILNLRSVRDSKKKLRGLKFFTPYPHWNSAGSGEKS